MVDDLTLHSLIHCSSSPDAAGVGPGGEADRGITRRLCGTETAVAVLAGKQLQRVGNRTHQCSGTDIDRQENVAARFTLMMTEGSGLNHSALAMRRLA
jgi:hypothetical protein